MDFVQDVVVQWKSEPRGQGLNHKYTRCGAVRYAESGREGRELPSGATTICTCVFKVTSPHPAGEGTRCSPFSQ